MVAERQSPYRMLLADDDVRFRETLKMVFGPFFELLEAASGEEAIEIVSAFSVDIILIDMHMDALTGVETVQQIRPIIPESPCILVTADVTDALIEDASAASIYSVLAKPVRKRELVQTVSSAIVDAYDDPTALSPIAS